MITGMWGPEFPRMSPDETPFPRMYRVDRQFRQPSISDVARELDDRLDALAVLRSVRPGGTVAVAAASRGTHDLSVLVDRVLARLKRLGLKPFLFPAMGSHGGGTAAGQAQVLRDILKLDAHPDVPIVSSMDVQSLGKIMISGEEGPEVWFSSDALKADHVVVINRVKPHTVFRSTVESGLCKILAVGCGKQLGAANMHKFDLGRTVIPSAELILSRVPVLFGVSVTETADGKTHSVLAVGPDEFVASDEAQLKLARTLLPTLPFDRLDLLLVDEMGKNISGPGMDTNVIGFWRRDGGERIPYYRFLGVLDITAGSQGNATGIGMADITTRRVFNKIDWKSTYLNSITAGTPRNGCCPIVAEHDRHLLELVLAMLPSGRVPRIAHIRNTLQLESFTISEPLVSELVREPGATVDPAPVEWVFNEEGRLLPAGVVSTDPGTQPG